LNRASAVKKAFTHPLGIRALLWSKLPLAAFAGLRVARLDESGRGGDASSRLEDAEPVRSTYFAAQAMAAEMSTGAPALCSSSRAARRCPRW